MSKRTLVIADPSDKSEVAAANARLIAAAPDLFAAGSELLAIWDKYSDSVGQPDGPIGRLRAAVEKAVRK